MKENDKIVFKYDGIELQYKVTQIDKRYWLSNSKLGNNIAIFNLLKIEDRFAFCEKEIGYPIISKTADFPEVNSLKDLEKIVNALYKRIIEISTPKFNVGDLVMVVKREGEGSDYPCTYMEEMVQYENRIFTISKINKMSFYTIKSFISKLRYEEPFYYSFKGIDWNWSSAMLHKVDPGKHITAQDIAILADTGVVNIGEAHSCINANISAITCDKAIDGPSLYPEKSEEPEYKLNFSVKPLKFYQND